MGMESSACARRSARIQIWTQPVVTVLWINSWTIFTSQVLGNEREKERVYRVEVDIMDNLFLMQNER